MMNPRVFREYDIRGVADRDLDDDFALDLGRALGTHLVRAGARSIALGRDCRLHSGRLRDAMATGLASTGIAVIDVGVVATPLLYWAVHRLPADGGVQITGSHNPPEDNGFKLLRGTASVYGEEIQQLRRLIEARDFVVAPAPGPITTHPVTDDYLDEVAAGIHPGPRRFTVVVDAGNGTGGVVGAPLLRRLGFEVIELYCDMDGRFPNHHPDPTVEENVEELRRAVAASGAELGIAFDGDADRLGVVDARGRIVWGDQLMILFARSILETEPGARFISEVKCSQALYDEIARAGGKPLMWKVGHSLIKAKMKEIGAALAGEMSGHLFFAHRYHGYDDAVYAAARLCELLSRSERTLTDEVDALPRLYNTPEIRVDSSDDHKFEVVRRVVDHFRAAAQASRDDVLEVIDVDGARVRFSGGWALVRASNTQPVLVLRFEADSHERLAAIRSLVERDLGAIQAIVGDVQRSQKLH